MSSSTLKSSSTILVIDDHPQVLQQRKNSLESFGYSVITATSAASAVSILENTPIAAVLLEYTLEGVDAEAVANQIKDRFPAQPIILLSAYSAVPERILWLVDEYVMRSDPIETLVRAIEELPEADKRKKTQKSAVAGHDSRRPVGPWRKAAKVSCHATKTNDRSSFQIRRTNY